MNLELEALETSFDLIAPRGAWTPEYERAWTTAFGVVSGAMLEGAAEVKLQLAA